MTTNRSKPTAIAVVLLLGMLGVVSPTLRATPNLQQDVERATDQKLFPDGRHFNFGTVTRGLLVTHAFRIVNRFDGPVHIVSVR